MQSYELTLPKKIVFGPGKRRDIGALARSLGRRALLILGSRTLERQGEVDAIVADLAEAGISVFATETISHEPEVGDVDRLLEVYRTKIRTGDFILSLGGGAAMDLGKAAAALLPQLEVAPTTDYLEGVGRELKLVQTPLPVMTLPTTAGTGAEATKNAVISSYDPPFKKSLRDDRMMPAVALVDPELTLSCPPAVTAESGMDAVTQLLESYVGKRRQPVTDALVEQGFPMAMRALSILCDNPGDLEARCEMAHAALLSGIALANAGLGMAHGVAPALGVHCRVPHGAACALMLPVTLKTNAAVCRNRYARLARLAMPVNASMNDEECVQKLIEAVESLCDRLKLPRRLSDLGIPASKIPELARDSKGSSMSGNPRELSTEEIAAILENV